VLTVLSRTLVLVYGIVSYLIGVAGLACIVLALARLVPFGFFDMSPDVAPLLWNLLLVAIWGGVHSAMARSGFKTAIIRMIPEAAERPTYVLIAGITSFGLVGFWQIVPGVLWSMSHPAMVYLLWGLFAFGWTYTLISTFAINHFDLFGLRQVYMNFVNRPRPPLEFTKRAMYRFTRHPIQTGVLIGVWATPEMTFTHLVLSAGFTVYIFIGLWFEEKDLVRDIGEPYEEYRQETGKLFPRLRTRTR